MFLLDADVFIRAMQSDYPMDVCPGFWQWLIEANQGERVASVHAVRRELIAREDELSAWALEHPAMFLVETEAVVRSLTLTSQWAYGHERYTEAAADEYTEAADSRLVAHAHAIGATVVTHERPAPNSVQRIKIPDACDALDVPWVPRHEMLRSEGVRFVLPGR